MDIHDIAIAAAIAKGKGGGNAASASLSAQMLSALTVKAEREDI